jgi:mono/diheme cytochrome c family protein
VELIVMKKFLKWLGLVVAGLVLIVIVGLAYIYFASEREIDRKYTAAEILGATMPTDPAEIAAGGRLAHLTGCRHCHGDDLTGRVPLDVPNVVRFVAPNLTAVAPQYSDAQLVGAIRRGVKLDNTSAWFMPSDMFMHLRREDLARIVAFVRSQPAQTGITGKTELRIVGRYIIASGKFKSSAADAAELTDDVATDLQDPVSRGRYLVSISCTECHGQDFKGRTDTGAPALAVAKGYSPEQFARLMRDGIGLGEREFELMTPTSRARFSHFTPEEVAAVHAFLQTL